MPVPTEKSRVVRFGIFEVDLQEAELRKSGMRIKLQGQPFQILTMLLERPGETVTREELRQRLWPSDTFVDFDHSLNSSIKKLREALSDDSGNPRFIETLHRRGYRFIAPVDGAVVVSPSLPSRRSAPWRWWPLSVAAIVLLSTIALWQSAGLRTSGLTRFTQITDDGRAKAGDRYEGIATDGQRIYFQEIDNEQFVVSEVSAAGGRPTPLRIPISDVFLYDISPDGSQLLIANFSGPDDGRMWTMTLPAGSPRRLGELYGSSGTWSPDGKTIYFTYKNDVYAANADGSSPHKLASTKGGTYFLRCSPDGRRLRFSVVQNDSVSLWEVDSDGTGLHPLLTGWHNPPRECCGNWTLDGRYFLFQTYSRAGPKDLWVLPEKRSLFVRDPKPIQLTNGPLEFFSPQPSKDGKKIFVVGLRRRSELVRYEPKSGFVPYLGGISASQVAFSSDGQWVAYVAQPEGTLWRSRVDGSERIQLTPPMEVMVPRWSPDGRQIAFMAWQQNVTKSFLIPSGGGTPREIVSSILLSEDPQWSPDGQSIALTLLDAEWKSQRISIVNLHTNTEMRLPGSESLFSPRWSPDGKYIAAITIDQQKLMLFDFGRRQWKELTSMWIGYPSWSHDGQFLYFDTLGRDQGFYRVRISDGKLELLVSLKGARRLWSSFEPWSGLGPDDSLLLQRDTSSEEIYAIDW